MDHRFVAQTMCNLTYEELWLPRREWALKRRPGGELNLRVGTGKKTYVRHAIANQGPLTLTYGVKMIESKINPEELCGWLTAKEILSRGYFSGEVNLLNSLAHTIIHEFGHVIQVLMGAREPGSSHSPEFYRILDKAHQNGHADHIRDRLNQICLSRDIDLSSAALTPGANQPAIRGSGLTLVDIHVGQQLYIHKADFREHNPLIVTKKNRKTVSLRSLKTQCILKGWPGALYREAP